MSGSFMYMLNAFSMMQVTKQSLPTQGVLVLTFVGKHKPNWEAQPLSDTEFTVLWSNQVQPRAPYRPSLLLPGLMQSSGTATQPGDPLLLGNLACIDAGTDTSGWGTQRHRASPTLMADGLQAKQHQQALRQQHRQQQDQLLRGCDGYFASVSGGQGGRASMAGGSSKQHIHAVSDGWKMELLQVGAGRVVRTDKGSVIAHGNPCAFVLTRHN